MSSAGKIKELAEEGFGETQAIRQHMHSHPELSFHEHSTARFIAEKLDQLGIPYQSGVAGTGLVALIEGKEAGKTIGLRADIDALPITETNDVAYKSQNNGVMHACGHDAHTASLLGAASILNQLKNEFSGTVKLLFQPAEEMLPGGASLMIKEGVLENPAPAQMIGQHVFPDLEVGKVGFKSGMYMASTDELYVTVKGKGGHAALPHKNIDPVLIAAHIIVSLQQIISRRTDPTMPSVLSFGKIIGEGSTNVIPDEVKLQGTFRAMDEEWRAKAHTLMVKMATDIATSMGGSCEFEVRKGYPYLENDPVVTAQCIANAKEYLGAENVVELPLRMTAEDFAYYSQALPSCFYRLGTRNEAKGITSGLHTSQFDIDEDALKIGSGMMAYLAYATLSSS